MRKLAFAFAIAAVGGFAIPLPASADDVDVWTQMSSSGYAHHRRMMSSRPAPRVRIEERLERAPERRQRTARRSNLGAGTLPERRNNEEWQGGPKPTIAPIPPQTVSFKSNYARGTIIIDTSRRKLFYVLTDATAYQYPVSVGREGFQWTGTNKVSRIQAWPTWRPPEEMREREPRLPKVMTGGINNPLGAKAIYLGDTLYRIHGTNNRKSIGRAASSGCFRMVNGHVMHLASITQIGATVVVMKRLPNEIATTISGGKANEG